VGILVTFVPPKVTARRGMSDKPTRGTAAPPEQQRPRQNATQQNEMTIYKTHAGHPPEHGSFCNSAPIPGYGMNPAGQNTLSGRHV